MEEADSVGPATDASNQEVGQAAGLGKDLLAGLAPDDALQVAHDERIRVRAEGRAEQIVGIAQGGGPVTQGLVDGILEGAAAGVHGTHLSAQQTHAQHVGGLALHVIATHVDDAFQAQQGSGGGGSDAMLSGASLGDEATLAHATGQEGLSEGVVDLVSAGVG